MPDEDYPKTQMIDLLEPKHEVEVILDTGVAGQGLSLWVNVDGICRLRVTRIDPSKVKLEGLLQLKKLC